MHLMRFDEIKDWSTKPRVVNRH